MAFSQNADERERQKQFFSTYLPRVDNTLSLENILSDYSDGIVNGNILEMKNTVTDLNGALLQAIKYLSARRIKGKPVPANILIVSLVAEKAWLFRSKDYLNEIETVYVGAASRNNSGFVMKPEKALIDYSTQAGQSALVAVLRERRWTKINLNEDCIVGWANTYYAMMPTASKEDFIGYRDDKRSTDGEIRQPSVLAEWIEPYRGRTNERFRYLMDMLNDFLSKKDLGAFFTPHAYAAKAAQLVRKAILRVPDGNDYVIIDRCAGTGNLELALTDEELSHCIVSTYEYFEYKVLMELLGDKVREVIPPTESDDTFLRGKVRGSDALSKEFVDNEIIRKYLDDDACTVILFENPPFAETTSMEHQKRNEGAASSAKWKGSWVVSEMRKDIASDPSIDGKCLNEMGNAFIWSAFKYYLRQPTDSYVVFSPIKYWKAQGLAKKKVLDGFCGDRQHFHALKHSCVAIILFANEESAATRFTLKAFDIVDNKAVPQGRLPFIKVRTTYSAAYYDKRVLGDEEESDFTVRENGMPTEGQKVKITPVRAESIIGYLVADSRGFDNPDLHSSLLVAAKYNGNGFYLRRDNFLEKLPLFAAARYISYNGSWTERGRIMKSGDGAKRYRKAVESGKLEQWLLKCCLFCCLEYQNHTRTLVGPDGHLYRNELCLDTTNGPTAASNAIARLAVGEKEKRLLDAWKAVLDIAKTTDGYNQALTYGLYQIGEELNTYHTDSESGQRVYDYPALNGSIRAAKQLAKDYYLSEIVPELFEYEFLK